MEGEDNDRSEVARILARIAAEYEAAQRALVGMAQGAARHSFITARMENMGDLHDALAALVGDGAMGLVAARLDMCQEATTP